MKENTLGRNSVMMGGKMEEKRQCGGGECTRVENTKVETEGQVQAGHPNSTLFAGGI